MNENIKKAYSLSVILKNRIAPTFTHHEQTYGVDHIRTRLLGLPLSQILLQILMYHANLYTFYDSDWYDKIGFSEAGRKTATERHDLFTKHLGYVSFFSSVETTFRELVKLLSPGSCNDGKAPFESIYKKLLKDLGLDNQIELFNFASVLRNTIHTNGHYYPVNNTADRTFVFRGASHTLLYSQEVDFLFADTVVEIQDEIFDCLINISNHNSLPGI